MADTPTPAEQRDGGDVYMEIASAERERDRERCEATKPTITEAPIQQLEQGVSLDRPGWPKTLAKPDRLLAARHGTLPDGSLAVEFELEADADPRNFDPEPLREHFVAAGFELVAAHTLVQHPVVSELRVYRHAGVAATLFFEHAGGVTQTLRIFPSEDIRTPATACLPFPVRRSYRVHRCYGDEWSPAEVGHVEFDLDHVGWFDGALPRYGGGGCQGLVWDIYLWRDDCAYYMGTFDGPPEIAEGPAPFGHARLRVERGGSNMAEVLEIAYDGLRYRSIASHFVERCHVNVEDEHGNGYHVPCVVNRDCAGVELVAEQLDRPKP